MPGIHNAPATAMTRPALPPERAVTADTEKQLRERSRAQGGGAGVTPFPGGSSTRGDLETTAPSFPFSAAAAVVPVSAVKTSSAPSLPFQTQAQLVPPFSPLTALPFPAKVSTFTSPLLSVSGSTPVNQNFDKHLNSPSALHAENTNNRSNCDTSTFLGQFLLSSQVLVFLRRQFRFFTRLQFRLDIAPPILFPRLHFLLNPAVLFLRKSL